MFRSIMTSAVEDGLLPSNPVAIRGASKERIIERPLLTWDEVGALAEAIDLRFHAFVWAAAASGLRFGELSGLTIAKFDVERSSITVSQALSSGRGYGPRLGEPKSESAYRSVLVPRVITDRVVEHMARFEVGTEPNALIFTSTKGRPLINRYFWSHWDRARTAVGLDGIRFHDLRHLAGTEAASAGGSLREVMARMGHSTPVASLRYLKASELRDQAISDAIALRIGTRLSPGT
ncbi:MAG: site-specific integrase [Ilumatobacteraceae bacterium]